MTVYMEFINLFFIPIISVYIMYNRKQVNEMAKIIMLYGIMVVTIAISSDMLGNILNKITGFDFSREGTKYGFLAIAVAMVIPYISEILKKSIKLNLEITKKNE